MAIDLRSSSLPNPVDLSMQRPFANLQNEALPPHSSHPAFSHLILLVFEAVLEVVCVSFPGYVVARQGMFNAEMQKFAANLNVVLFTPCLIFTKLASQLTADKLAELAVIPVIFAVQTLVSFVCSITVSKLFRFRKRPRNFVVAMGVFGNSNSLPISLVISLSQTIRGLHWGKIPGDNDNEVAARGILYLLIFQQLGQLVRWSWGYHVLLAPPDKYADENAHANSQLEQGFEPYSDLPSDEQRALMGDAPSDEDEVLRGAPKFNTDSEARHGDRRSRSSSSEDDGEQTPITHQPYTSSVSSKTSRHDGRTEQGGSPALLPMPANGNIAPSGNHSIDSYPRMKSSGSSTDETPPVGLRGWITRAVASIRGFRQSILRSASENAQSLFLTLPIAVQRLLRKTFSALSKFVHGVWDFMNPPLWAMFAAIIVASVPSLQRLFFSEGTFVQNSITSAIRQMGGVAVPLILVVLGANLEGKTQPEDPNHSDEDAKEETKLLIACLLSRMLLPIIIMAPLLALAAKYVPVSILDDPIFVIVCFLLTGAPSALQLAQICQINGVYLGVMSRLLFQSYVVCSFPYDQAYVLEGRSSMSFTISCQLYRGPANAGSKRAYLISYQGNINTA
ncbi:MAG: hypothetical protein L6R37_007232 [Teloschistes peruensis]|nr:MAG: hypothetical protein L6R37_007232 [Teloschistes peruensis]